MKKLDLAGMERALRQTRAMRGGLPGFLKEFLFAEAVRAAARAAERSPVDTGRLRAGWRLRDVRRQGNGFVVEIVNSTPYASHVEHGHRTAGGTQVGGRFMLRLSMAELERSLPGRLRAAFAAYRRKYGWK